ncbi:hypothetical protein REPUB_Repub18cG0124800 [Reevesia pubescens]
MQESYPPETLSPLGCLPALRALNFKDNEGKCLEAASALAQAHNNALKAVLSNLEHTRPQILDFNFYEWLDDRVNNPSKYSFKDGVNACCGTGPYGGVYTCGGTRMSKTYQLCDNADDHVWWDSFHATERIHEHFAKALWSGNPSSVEPYNLEDLFFNKEKLTIADIIDSPEGDHFQ